MIVEEQYSVTLTQKNLCSCRMEPSTLSAYLSKSLVACPHLTGVLMAFLSHSRQVLGWYLQEGHSHFLILPQLLQLKSVIKTPYVNKPQLEYLCITKTLLKILLRMVVVLLTIAILQLYIANCTVYVKYVYRE